MALLSVEMKPFQVVGCLLMRIASSADPELFRTCIHVGVRQPIGGETNPVNVSWRPQYVGCLPMQVDSHRNGDLERG
jgi:hypothetical protein